MIRRRVSGGSMGGGLKGRANPWEIKYTNQFSSKLDLPFPCWTESNRPSRTSRWCWRRRSIWCCDAWCFELSSLSFSLYLSLYLYLFGYWTAIVADVFLVVVFVLGFNYLIWQYFFDDVVFHCVRQKAFIHSLIAHSTNIQTHTHAFAQQTHTHTAHNYSK